MNRTQLFSEAIKACILASREILKVYEGEIEVEMKDDRSPLTEADKRANAQIVKILEGTSVPILSEEGAEVSFQERSSWTSFWLVDPLDGTKEFIKRNGEFTVNVALIEDNYPTFVVIYVPVTGLLYFGGVELGGSFKLKTDSIDDLNLESLMKRSQKLPIEKANEKQARVVGSRSHMSPETLEFVESLKAEGKEVEMVSMGSSLKICLVAEGSAEYYPRFAPTMEWDTGAGQAIAEAAGRSLIDWTTKERKRYNNEILRNNWFLVN